MPSASTQTDPIFTTTAQDDAGSLRFDCSRHVIPDETRDGRHGLFFGRLPLELFDHIATYLESQDLVRVSAVCRAWRGAVLGRPGLWNCLGWLDIEQQESVDLARVVAGRARGALRSVLLFGSGIREEEELAVTTLRQILRQISIGDGGRNVREIALNMHRYEGAEEYLESLYSCIVLVAQFAQFAAVNLRMLTIESALPRYPSSPFLFALPSLHHLRLTSESDEPDEDTRLPEFWQTSSMRTKTSSLVSLVLSGTCLNYHNFPSFPYLRSIELYQVELHNLVDLVSKCAETLETLWLRDVEISWPPHSPPPQPTGLLVLPSLADLQICGDSPLLWNLPTIPSNRFAIQCPALRKVSLADQDRYYPEDYEEQYPASRALTVEVLSTLFRVSAELSNINLRGTNATPSMLCDSLPSASHALSTLDLSNVATDELVDRLHGLVPSLSHLIVEGLYIDASGTASPSVSLPALARLASRLLPAAHHDRLGTTQIRLVADGSMRRDASLDAALPAELRKLLLPLWSFQIKLLTDSLVDNSPPGGPSLTELKQEVVALGKRLLPIFRKVGTATELDEARTVAGQHAFDAAQDMMHRWLEMKEANAAVQWCAECPGVELVCGADDEDDEV